MKKITRSVEMHAWSSREHQSGHTVGFVPTMGALHEGHASLVRAARKKCDRVVVSIFVNPTQFGPHEDFQKYPRPIQNDMARLLTLGADAVFVPTVAEIYPPGDQTRVRVGTLSEKLCGPFRPGHFEGVATVVLRLLNIVHPDSAFFGRKDFQQQLIVKQMCKDLHLPIRIVDLPTVREKDGLAMSSRNRYLSEKERGEAGNIYKALKQAETRIRAGVKGVGKLEAEIRETIQKISGAKIDYVAICDPATLEDKKMVTGKTLIAVAAWVGRARLIDNIVVKR